MKPTQLLKSPLVALAALFLHGTHALGADPDPSVKAAITAESQRWAKAWNRRDVKAVSELYTDGAKLLPEGSDMISGKEAIFLFLKKERDATWPDDLTFTNIEVYGGGQVATECSEVEIRDKNGVLKGRGKQILIFLNQDGKWKLHRDIWTSTPVAKP